MRSPACSRLVDQPLERNEVWIEKLGHTLLVAHRQDALAEPVADCGKDHQRDLVA